MSRRVDCSNMQHVLESNICGGKQTDRYCIFFPIGVANFLGGSHLSRARAEVTKNCKHLNLTLLNYGSRISEHELQKLDNGFYHCKGL
jgi:hypothetical protein